MKECGFHHLHLHTDFSLLDGFGKVADYAERAKQLGMEYLSVTDHGAMGVIPSQIAACENNGINPIIGIELYVNPLQIVRENKKQIDEYRKSLSEDQQKIYNKSFHLLAIAFNQEGYSNLVKLSSWGWLFGKGGKPPRPRVNHEQLMTHKNGIIFTSCCYISEIGQAFDRGGEDEARNILEKYIAMFGDNFYLELMLLDFVKQKPYDAFLLKMHDIYKIPLIVSNDCHYTNKTDSKFQRLMLMQQTGRTLKEIEEALRDGREQDFFELQDSNLWMKSESEIDEKWENDYRDIIDKDLFLFAKSNTLKICEKAKGLELDRSLKLPQIPDAEEKLKEEIMKGFKKRNLPREREYLDRIKEEFDLFKRKGFCSYFLILKMMVDEARRAYKEMYGGDGSAAAGCGRGSQAASLVTYCIGLHDVNPIEHDLLFSRFMSENRGGKSMKLRFTQEPISP